MKTGPGQKWDWCALMIDVHPDELKHCLCKTAFLYVHPNQCAQRVKLGSASPASTGTRMPPGTRWENMIATRH
jgi:hypothetical protein